MTREEFLSKTNSYGVPGYTDEELKEYASYDNVPVEYVISYCSLCHQKTLAGEICSMCGQDQLDSVHRGERMQYRKMIKYDPNYIWEVNHEDHYPEWVYKVPVDPVDLTAMFTDTFGNDSVEEYSKQLKNMEHCFNYLEVSHEKDYVYSHDVKQLLEMIHSLTGDNLDLAIRAMGSAFGCRYDIIFEKLSTNECSTAEGLEKLIREDIKTPNRDSQ